MKFKDFKNIVHAVSNAAGKPVVHFWEAGTTPNFHTAEIKNKTGSIFILNSLDNHWAYSSTFNPTGGTLTFVDDQELSTVLASLYTITPLLKADLIQPYNLSILPQYHISQAPTKDITYWKPQTLGELLFNWWD